MHQRDAAAAAMAGAADVDRTIVDTCSIIRVPFAETKRLDSF